MKINRVFTWHIHRSRGISIFITTTTTTTTLECHDYCLSSYRPSEIRYHPCIYEHPVTPSDTQRSKPHHRLGSIKLRHQNHQPLLSNNIPVAGTNKSASKLGVSRPNCKWVGHEEHHLATGVVVVLSSLYPTPLQARDPLHNDVVVGIWKKTTVLPRDPNTCGA